MAATEAAAMVVDIQAEAMAAGGVALVAAKRAEDVQAMAAKEMAGAVAV